MNKRFYIFCFHCVSKHTEKDTATTAIKCPCPCPHHFSGGTRTRTHQG